MGQKLRGFSRAASDAKIENDKDNEKEEERAHCASELPFCRTDH